jgi:hypothetical protein
MTSTGSSRVCAHPLIGEDLALQLPRNRSTSLLAGETNGDPGDLLPSWGGWTSDLDRSAAVAARTPTADHALLGMLINDLGPWLAGEYLAVHGQKVPR